MTPLSGRNLFKADALMIPANVIQILIEIGKSGVPDAPATATHLESIGGFGWINREHWGTWDEITYTMPTDDLMALTRGLTIAENHHHWIGGSVSAVIWTFRRLQERDPAVADEVADWILPRTRNPWVPYGSQNHGARSFEEYHRAEQRIDLWKKKRAKEIEDTRNERHVRNAQRKRSTKDRDSGMRQNFITELNQLTLQEQLHQLATDETYSVEFYPTRIAGAATEEVINSLDEDTLMALRKKLKGKKRGPWSNFKQRLLRRIGRNSI